MAALPRIQTNPTPITREEWLIASAELIFKDIIGPTSFEIPEGVSYQVSCGWPAKGALAIKKRVIGQCWNPASCADKTTAHIFISPFCADPMVVLETLVHELGHACCPKAGHKGAFKTFAYAVGLEGKLTATHAGEALQLRLNAIIDELGDYPHAKLDGMNMKKQSTRLHKVECGECGYTVRVTNKWIDRGLPTCPCGGEMNEAEGMNI